MGQLRGQQLECGALDVLGLPGMRSSSHSQDLDFSPSISSWLKADGSQLHQSALVEGPRGFVSGFILLSVVTSTLIGSEGVPRVFQGRKGQGLQFFPDRCEMGQGPSER